MRQGRPIRFIGQLLLAWIAMRGIMLSLPPAVAPSLWETAERAEALSPSAGARGRATGLVESQATVGISPVNRGIMAALRLPSSTVSPAIPLRPVAQGGWTPPVADALLASAVAFAQEQPGSQHWALAAMGPGRGHAGMKQGAAVPAAALPVPALDGSGQRWSGSAWLLMRTASAVPGATQLGGSQAGFRVDRAVPVAGLSSLHGYGRVSGPTRAPWSELALGLSARPVAALPVSVAIERRQQLDAGGRAGAAAYVAGGIGPRALGHGLDVEGYGQAGVVGLPGIDGFIDGRIAVGRRIAGRSDQSALRLSLSAEGAAQPGVGRIDIGPQIETRLPLPVPGAVIRLSGGWRERIAGRAAPGSGPALVMVASF